jgi:murein DD-endopeptidase MepM/ murein hydrolase activator NlpD
MARRLLFCLACMLLLAAPASGEDIHRKKREIDERISTLQSKLAHAHAQEGVLTGEITVVNAKISALVDDVSRAQNQLSSLESQLAASQLRLDRTTQLFALQTRKLELLRREYGVALARLERRVLDAYETPSVNAIDVLLASTSVSDLLNDIEYVQQIGMQDKRVSDQLDTAKRAMHSARERTREIKRRVAAETAAVRSRTEQQHAVTQQLISTQQQLATARESKQATLSTIQESEKDFLHEVEGLQASSAALAARIRSAGSSTSSSGQSGTVSAAGLIWPVNGPITSPFGWRWGRMHEGIDIGVPSGTPIHAAASGTVIYAGWMEGYGNLVVIDHGNGLATAYGHQSSIAAGNGSGVSQGQVIGYVGCTGHCFGPHLHFEVRVNGEPVNPLNYL